MDDYSLKSYFFELPQSLIAQKPPLERGGSRLMVISRSGELAPEHADFCNLASHLPKEALLVANNSRVVPARLKGLRPGGGNAEFLLLTPLPLIARRGNRAHVKGLIRPAAKIRPGDILTFGSIKAAILEKRDYGQCLAELSWQDDLEKAITEEGRLPLPPYIRRDADQSDLERYQTIYASQSGSIAAPTAGLHFTGKIRESLEREGIGWQEISLHVGYGTFSPVREMDIRNHAIHSEYATISETTANAILNAKKSGRPIIAIGTTSARALEGSFSKMGEIAPYSGLIDIFLYPGKAFNVIDGLLTNFHLPESSLLMLVSAFAGKARIMQAYAEAIRCDYRFFSYGDAMLITPGEDALTGNQQGQINRRLIQPCGLSHDDG